MSHIHSPTNYNKIFSIGILLNIAFVVAEVIYGLTSNSMALLADAGHNLSDVLGLILAWGANFISKRQATRRRTYGWKSATIMAALINSILLMSAIGGIAWESIRRINSPLAIQGDIILIVAAIGFVINALTAMLFLEGRKKDLNIRGAFLHMAADAGVSLGVAVGGIAIIFTGKTWIDPILSLIISVIILVGTWQLFKNSMNMILQAAPQEIDVQGIWDYLLSLTGVKEVHDFHIWAMSTSETALTAHIVKPIVENEDDFLLMVCKKLKNDFNIDHVTIQIERTNIPESCDLECHLNNTE